MSLLDKIRKARQSEVEIDGRKWTLRRPTDEEALKFRDSGLLDWTKIFVIGWELTELDLITGGDGAKVPFDAEVFAEWVADQPALWEPLGMAILNSYKAHSEKRETALKK